MSGIVLILVALAPTAAASRKTIEFSQESCGYQVSFDPTRLDEPRLRATIAFLYTDQIRSDREPQLMSYDDVPKANLPAYQTWCAAEATRLDALSLLDVAGIEGLRQRRIAEHHDRCALVEAEVKGARGDINALKIYALSHPYCDGYADALGRSDKDFVPAWQAFAAHICRANSNKPDCKRDQLAWLGKPDGMQRLRTDLLVFGWYNCANEHSLMNQGDDGGKRGPEGARMRDAVEARFEKLFKVKSLGCDTPD